MIHRISLIVLLAGSVAGRVRSVPCGGCEGAGHSGDVSCMNAKEMRDRVDHIEPLKPSGLDKGLNLAGVVVMEIRFESSGKVVCARAKSGHPIAVSAAMEAVPQLTFKTSASNGGPEAGAAQFEIYYRLFGRRIPTDP